MDAIITAFSSGKGGTGKSTVAALTGAALAALGRKVVLIELAGGMRSLDVTTQVSEQVVFDLEDVLSGRIGPGRAVVESPLYPGLSVILAPYTGGRILPENVELLCQRFAHFYDHVLLDVSTGATDAYTAAALVAHRVILVQTPDAVSLRDGRLLADIMRREQGHMRLILNRIAQRRVLQDNGLADLDEAIDTVGVQLLGVVPESDHIHRAFSAGTALPAGSFETDVFCAIARRICGEDVPLLVR